jgi:ubiquinone/menaquinone biosynthesis methyltransferase
MAGGTGDIAFRLQDRLAASNITSTEIAICDLNREMLAAGRDRAINSLRHQKKPQLSWYNINAEILPFADNSADCYTIAFGIRNVTDIPKALKEAYRCLKPGSMMACLEFSPRQTEWLQPIYDRYSFNIMPMLGKLVANDEASYRYLAESIRMFPEAEKFSAMLKTAGFDRVDVTSMTGGIVNLHREWKL